MDTDTWDFYPLQDGTVPPSSPRMRPIRPGSTDPRDAAFLFDRHFPWYRQAKLDGRLERIGKYYRRLTEDLDIGPIIRTIVSALTKDSARFRLLDDIWTLRLSCKLTGEVLVFRKDDWTLINCYEEDRTTYLDAFDALAMQLQCDLVLVTVRPDGSNYASHISLFHPNGWSAEEAIGRSFEEIHAHVLRADGQAPVIPNGTSLVQGLVRSPTVLERVGALSFRPNAVLDRHPGNPAPGDWDFSRDDLYLRFERQTIIPVPEANSFLFSIHTLFDRLADPGRIDRAIEAIRNPHPECYPRESLAKNGAKFLGYLESKTSDPPHRITTLSDSDWKALVEDDKPVEITDKMVQSAKKIETLG